MHTICEKLSYKTNCTYYNTERKLTADDSFLLTLGTFRGGLPIEPASIELAEGLQVCLSYKTLSNSQKPLPTHNYLLEFVSFYCFIFMSLTALFSNLFFSSKN
jgi:hypothetical protein